MPRTIRRQPFSVSTNNNSHPQSYFFNHNQFAGIITNKNDTTVDPRGFEDVKNVYVDEDGTLVSRAPFKFIDTQINIVEQWTFGVYQLCLYKYLCLINDGKLTILSNLKAGEFVINKNELFVVYSLRCTSHSMLSNTGDNQYNEYHIQLKANTFGNDYDTFLKNYNDLQPKIFCKQIEDKIFVWFAGLDLITLNTNGVLENGIRKLYFEDAKSDLYIPIHEIYANDVRSTFEAKNKLTSGYIRRYQHSALNYTDFGHLRNKNLRVSIDGESVTDSSYLYDYKFETQDALIYPLCTVGDGTITVADTPRTYVVLRDSATDGLSVSFGGKIFKRLPKLDAEILSVHLTKDGLHVIALTTGGIYYCSLVDSTTDEQYEEDEFKWAYKSYSITGGLEVFAAQFDTLDLYAYIGVDNRGKVRCFYSDGTKEKEADNPREYMRSDYKHIFKFSYDKGKPQIIVLEYNDRYIYDVTIYVYTSLIGTFEGIRETGIDTTKAYLAYSDVFILDIQDFYVYFKEVDEENNSYSYRELAIKVHDEFNEGGIPKITSEVTTLVTFNGYTDPQIPIYARGRKDFLSNEIIYRGGTFIVPKPNDDYREDMYPILYTDAGIYYKIGAKLWTSVPSTTIVNLDVVEGADASGKLTLSSLVPDYSATLSEHYFSFDDLDTGHHLLEVTDTRRNLQNLEYELYVPIDNEQKFTNKITNLHPLSDTVIGIFTRDEIWYISAVTLNDATVAYTKPIKSRIPTGCRDGDEILTTADGQTIVFATPQGIAAVAPQDFIATTEKSLSYITDNIYNRYYDFYVRQIGDYKPQIHISSYKRFLLFYKYMQREVLVLDLQSATWWMWETQYPIISFYTDTNLYALMQVDFMISTKLSLQGVRFIYTDKGFDVIYRDDVITVLENDLLEVKTTNGTIVDKGNQKVPVKVLLPATSEIEWHLISQKLYFDQINNYKAIKGINLNVKDMEVFCAKLFSKVYRNASNPGQVETLEFDIKDLRTFVKRFNLLQVISFQYALQNDTQNDTPYQLRLNSMSVKYEVKERIR